MDIRNIKGPAPTVDPSKELEAIWDLQKDLLEGYIGKIEKDLPMYPIDIDTFKGQQILKDFSARIIEETAEGYESTSLVLRIFLKYDMNSNLITDDEWRSVLNHLQNSNEEQADAVAFYINLFLYAGLDIKDIYEYLHNRLFTKVNCLSELMRVGYMFFDNLVTEVLPFTIFPDSDQIKSLGYDPDDVRGYIPAFHKSSIEAHKLEGNMLWEVCYHINIGRNFLKNKPWKQTQELTDVTRYSEQIILGFIKYMGYLYAQGFTPQTLYTLFYKKHMVNKFRQRSGY